MVNVAQTLLLSVSLYAASATALTSVTPVQGVPISKLGSFKRPVTIPTPADNAMTPARVILGKALFFDPRLSRSGKMSCASCHDPAKGWEDGKSLNTGDNGKTLGRHTPTLLNIAWAKPLFWDGRSETLEAQAKLPMTSPAEMNMSAANAVAFVRASPEYRDAFAAAYADRPIDIDTISAAIASFERSIVSKAAPFDRRVSGDRRVYSTSAENGFALFVGKGHCATCHMGWRLTDDSFHDIGLPGTDLGRGGITPDIPALQHAFKTPTLRNIAQRAPYMHDGSIATLAAVVDYYNQPRAGNGSRNVEIEPLRLTPAERADLVAFLLTLSSADQVPIVTAQNSKKE